MTPKEQLIVQLGLLGFEWFGDCILFKPDTSVAVCFMSDGTIEVKQLLGLWLRTPIDHVLAQVIKELENRTA